MSTLKTVLNSAIALGFTHVHLSENGPGQLRRSSPATARNASGEICRLTIDHIVAFRDLGLTLPLGNHGASGDHEISNDGPGVSWQALDLVGGGWTVTFDLVRAPSQSGQIAA